MNHIDINNTVCLSKYILFLGRLSLVETSLNINFTPPTRSIIGRMAAYLGVYRFYICGELCPAEGSLTINIRIFIPLSD